METQIETNAAKQPPSLIGIFTSPGEQFKRIRTNPKIWVPLLIVAVVNAVGMGIMAMMMDSDMLIKQGVPEENADTILGFTRIAMVATGVITPAIGALISSAIMIAVAKISNAPVTFRQLFSMNTYISFVAAIGHLLNMAVGYLIGADAETHVTSLGGLLGKGSSGVLGAIELFAIWGMVLTAIGLYRTARFPKGLAWAVAIVFFLFGIGLAAIGTLMQGAPKL
ncbi:YIP1 family protein [Neobacillus piezotolerans]|uniref:YIP1 family protein n=1 Tax=Neobacillus piezotolerans TaxID=2259171 RepID=A0A3D8GQM3_9BACI|nr:Yip1 family protein [Neobacillus piezotolerans]RDU36790.1 YIP1 family protein [Neobacillus piezotolerans]